MKKELKCHIGIGPKVEGVALVAHDNFSARYDLDRIKGVFSRPQHQLFGKSYKDLPDDKVNEVMNFLNFIKNTEGKKN